MSEVNNQASSNESSPLIDLNNLSRFKTNLDVELAKKNKDVNLSVVNGKVCITYTEEE